MKFKVNIKLTEENITGSVTYPFSGSDTVWWHFSVIGGQDGLSMKVERNLVEMSYVIADIVKKAEPAILQVAKDALMESISNDNTAINKTAIIEI